MIIPIIILTVLLMYVIMNLPKLSLKEKKYLIIFILLFTYGSALFIPLSQTTEFESSIECDDGWCHSTTKQIGETVMGDSTYDKIVEFFTTLR